MSVLNPTLDQPLVPTRPRRRGRLRPMVGLLGPAFVVSAAYVDPGNFATNISAGARFGPALLWVVAVANVMAMLVQYLSGKLAIATGANLPELCREHYPRPVVLGLWAQAELVAIATDLAEFVGAAIALNLLFDVPLLPAGLITAGVTFAVLALQPSGRRRFETVVISLLGIVLAGFLYDVLITGTPDRMASGFVPNIPANGGMLLAAGIVGATVMPHAIYLHSDLSRRSAAVPDRGRALRMHRIDIAVALGLAGLVNMTMLVIAAAALHGGGLNIETLEEAHYGLAVTIGSGAALAFAVALLASGLASSSVGTYSGQVIMAGFLRRRMPLFLRRGVTMAPALLVLGLGIDPTQALVVSQVLLAFGIPFALVPLVLLTRRPDVMGALVNRRRTTVAGVALSAVIIGLNVVLLATQAGMF